MRDILWNSKVLGAMKEHGCLSEEETIVMIDWAHGRSVAYTSMERHMCITKVNDIRKRIREKYDSIHGYAGLDPRRK